MSKRKLKFSVGTLEDKCIAQIVNDFENIWYPIHIAQTPQNMMDEDVSSSIFQFFGE